MRTSQYIPKESDHLSQTYIQPQLEIGKEDDVHEKEANQVADKVMRMPDPGDEQGKMMESKPRLQKMTERPVVMKMTESPAKPKMQESGIRIQKQTNGASAGIAAPEQVEQGISSSKGSGQSLAPELQQEMGSKMNADLSDIKIHTGEHAAQMNKEVGAKAFTHGNDIYFNSGQYNPASSHGKHLLAHELTHTVQQGTGLQRKVQRMPDDEIREYLVFLSSSHTIEMRSDSKAKARAAYNSWLIGKQFLDNERKALIIRELLFAGVEPIDDFRIIKILTDATDDQLKDILNFGRYRLSTGILIGSVNLGPDLLKRIRILEAVEPVLSVQDYDAIAQTAYKAIRKGPGDAVFVALQKLQQHPEAINKFNTAFKKLYPDGAEQLIRKEMKGAQMNLALELIGLGADARSMVEVTHISAAELDAAAANLRIAIAARNAEAVYRILIPFNRNKVSITDLKARYIALTGNSVNADIVASLDADEASYAQYLLDAPKGNTGVNIEAAAARVTNGRASWKSKGKRGKVPGGDVNARTGTKIAGVGDDWFSFGYKGGLSADSFWMQVIWREMIVSGPAGKRRLNNAYNYNVGGGRSKPTALSPDPDNPVYEIDTTEPKIVNPGSPAYEIGGGDNRDVGSTEMFDRPSSMAPFARAEFVNNNATKVVSKAHFDTFLIRDNRPVFHNKLVVTWIFHSAAEAAADVPRKQRVTKTDKKNVLPDDIRVVLHTQYPNYDYIR